MGKSARGDLGVQNSSMAVPGPGNYVAKTSFTLRADPRWGFGTSKRPKQQSSSTKDLGPGAYNIPQKTGIEGSKYTMAGVS